MWLDLGQHNQDAKRYHEIPGDIMRCHKIVWMIPNHPKMDYTKYPLVGN